MCWLFPQLSPFGPPATQCFPLTGTVEAFELLFAAMTHNQLIECLLLVTSWSIYQTTSNFTSDFSQSWSLAGNIFAVEQDISIPFFALIFHWKKFIVFNESKNSVFTLHKHFNFLNVSKFMQLVILKISTGKVLEPNTTRFENRSLKYFQKLKRMQQRSILKST